MTCGRCWAGLLEVLACGLSGRMGGALPWIVWVVHFEGDVQMTRGGCWVGLFEVRICGLSGRLCDGLLWSMWLVHLEAMRR